MIDIRLIRENPKLVKENMRKRFHNKKTSLVDETKKLDEKWRKLKYEEDKLRHERNDISEKINQAKKKGGSAKALISKAKKIPGKIEEIEKKRKTLMEKIRKNLSEIPNIIHSSVPSGKDESKNKVLKKWGKIPKFSFPVKNHVQLLEKSGLVDFDKSAKVSGKGFYFLKKELALLNRALINFTIDFMKKKGYEYIETPLILNKKFLFASMDKEAIEESVYFLGDDKGLIGTAEQSLLAMHAGDVIPENELPKKYFSYSMCFRKEIGSHGINEKGLWRTHQFNKVEQFIFCKPENSEKIYNELLKNSEEILQMLKLPYRVLEMCSGDLAHWKHRSADLEVYRPTTKQYEEVMSLSNCTDYQARKLGIKVLRKKGEREILHTLNNTALATSRIMVAIVENFQQKDGSIKIPHVLHKYMSGLKKISSVKMKK